MKFSIITPTHNTKYLKELELSILAQTYENWEWVILLNNGANYQATDPRIKVHKLPFKSDKIGEIKNYAFNKGQGDILVEVDHDDLLTPDCLEELSKAYQDKEIGFVYSDNAKLGKFIPYHECYGWTYKKYKFQNQELFSMNTQPLYPGRFGYIWYAPDHVRSWRTSVYKEVGGHNKDLSVCDDLDLMHRTYLITKFKHIQKTLYIYRIDGNNSWLKRNKLIQSETRRLYKQNIMSLAKRYCELNKLKMIDLCGGFNKPQGFISIDLENGDIQADLNKGIPLPDNSCGIVRAFDALEHLENKQNIMKEIHRVLAPGGLLISMTPSTDGRGAFQDPTHISFWNQNSFWYWIRPNLMKYIQNKNIKFRECRLETKFPTDWHKENNISYVFADLEAIK
ncbi:MAG: glycosyltransferase [Spirochaetia bacterium]|nr:glycosyltransferase [Spirochaetia bacterium]